MHSLEEIASSADITSAWWIALAAMLAPMLATITHRKIPDVVWLLGLGTLIGPFGLHLATQTPGITFVRDLGLGLLFFLAGLEVHPDDMRDPAGRRSARTWILCFLFGIGVGLIMTHGQLKEAVVLGLAATSTALGTLLPILKDSGQLDTPLGQSAMRHGAVGELGPILAMTLLLSSYSTLDSALILLLFALAAVLTVAIPHHFFFRIPWVGRAMLKGTNTTMQTTLRFAMLILLSLMLLSSILKLDIVLGAFMAGMLIGQLIPAKYLHEFCGKIEVLGFSFLIPVFFVTSGMSINVHAVGNNLGLLVAFVFIILAVRGLPVFIRELGPAHWAPKWLRNIHAVQRQTLGNIWEKLALGFYTATGLPIIVAVTEVAVSSHLLPEEDASVLIAAGALTVLFFPLIANLLLRQGQKESVKKSASAKSASTNN